MKLSDLQDKQKRWFSQWLTHSGSGPRRTNTDNARTPFSVATYSGELLGVCGLGYAAYIGQGLRSIFAGVRWIETDTPMPSNVTGLDSAQYDSAEIASAFLVPSQYPGRLHQFVSAFRRVERYTITPIRNPPGVTFSPVFGQEEHLYVSADINLLVDDVPDTYAGTKTATVLARNLRRAVVGVHEMVFYQPVASDSNPWYFQGHIDGAPCLSIVSPM